MTQDAWITIGGALAQVLIGVFFFGRTYQMIRGISRDGERTDRRVDSIELRLNDHTERIARMEGRAD